MRMKFTKMSSIRRYRIFRNFAWPASVPDLARYNVFYGWNGSGKTTLSSILYAIERNTILDSGECELAFEGGSIRGSEFASDKPRPAVRVFNRAYVDGTVFRSGNPGVPPIYFVSEGGKEKQERVEEIALVLHGDDGKGGLDAEQASASMLLEKANADLENYAVDQATKIRNELRSGGQNQYNNYDKRGFKQGVERLLGGGEKTIAEAILDEAQRKELRLKKNAAPQEKIVFGRLPNVNVPKLIAAVEGIGAKTVVSQALDGLARNPRAEQWVRAGLPLHSIQADGKHAENCIFCDQPLKEARVSELEAHFNESYQRFIIELDEVMAGVDRAATDLSRRDLPKTMEIAEHLRERYTAAREALDGAFSEQHRILVRLQEVISDKSRQPFKSLELADYFGDGAIDTPRVSDCISQMEQLVEEHNHGVDTFEQTVLSARQSIEQDMLAAAALVYKGKKEAPQALEAAVNEIREKRGVLKVESNTLEREIRQHSIPAEELNAELRAYLGRDELKFMVEGAGYKIDRAGVQATDLSEGEKTAIAFLYFLKSLKGTNFDLENGVVVIDDPASSLDANSLFCSFAYMSKKTLDAGQLIILTHNFLFLKQVKNWFEYLPKGQVRHYMIESYMESDGRAARVVKLDKLLRDHQSEYHYLFGQVVLGSQMHQGLPLETYYGLPNMARRLLEVFLGFRYPAKKGFHKRIEEVKSEPATVARIRRFVHTYSHEEGDGDEIDTTMLAEAPVVLSAILDLIRTEDRGHYDEMKALCAVATAE
jgi:wobble nucleotide-excising tRNase